MKTRISIPGALFFSISLLVNWFVLSVFFAIVAPRYAGLLSVLTVLALAGFSLTRPAEVLVRFYLRCRRPTREEMAQLEGPWNSVLNASGLEERRRPVLFVSDQQYPNAYAAANRTVCVTRGLLKTGTAEEIEGVLAHEVGHLVHGDTKRRTVVMMVNTVGNIASWVLLGILTLIGAGFTLKGIAEDREEDVLTGMGVAIFAFFLKGCLWVLQKLIELGFLAVGRKEEFAADAYSRELGFANGLVSFLRKTEHLDVNPVGVWAVLTASHPPTPVRIDKLMG